MYQREKLCSFTLSQKLGPCNIQETRMHNTGDIGKDNNKIYNQKLKHPAFEQQFIFLRSIATDREI